MNIFVCTHGPANAGTQTSQVWRVALVDTLKSMGHKVYESSINWVSAFQPSQFPQFTRETRSEILLREVSQVHKDVGIDLFLSHFFNQHVFPETIKLIGSLGIPTVNFFCDNVRYHPWVSEIIASFTLNWVPEWEAKSLYEKARVPYIFLPMAADPKLYRPYQTGETKGIVFVGGPDPERYLIIAKLKRAGMPVEVYGAGWGAEKPSLGTNLNPIDRAQLSTNVGSTLLRRVRRGKVVVINQHNIVKEFGLYGLYRKFENRYIAQKYSPEAAEAWCGIVSDEQMVKLYSSSKVSIGINRVHEVTVPRLSKKYSKLRDFEAPMSGACYLTEHCSDVEINYDVGTEIWTYTSEDDLIQKSRELLASSALRSNLRKAARQAAVSRHTWAHRFEALFKNLSLSIAP